MKNKAQTIRKIVGMLNNPEEDGGFWLPNIQRPFVWSDEQICRLFDSLMRQYPISTLLVWKSESPIRRRKFIDNWKAGLKISHFFVPEDNKKKCLVLDGQQRLQALYIALKGSHESRELAFDILSGEVAAPDDIKYRFRFLLPGDIMFPWVRMKDLVFFTGKQREKEEELAGQAGRPLTGAEIDKIRDHLDLIDRTFKINEVVSYQELDSLDDPTLYTEDDVVEVFIRANSGGTRLAKSDLLFSLLSASWDVADEELEALLDTLNRHGFEFDRDFILKTALTVLRQGSRYEVSKFRSPVVREELQKAWPELTKSLEDVLDFVRGKTYMQSDKAMPTYLVLIPLVYLRHHYPQIWNSAPGKDAYLLRSSLTGAFSGNPDRLLDAVVKRIDELQTFDLSETFGVIRSQGRSLELTRDRFWSMGYGSDTVHLLFNMWYDGFNYTPAYRNNLPEVDHIFPQSRLRKIKAVNPTTGRKDVMRYPEAERNQLANCMLLTKQENGSGGKTDTLPADWFDGKPDSYLDLHLIPKDRKLWQIDRFDDFIAERKKLIEAKFAHLLV